MASAKTNQAIIESVLNSLSRAKYDPNRAAPGLVRLGMFTDRVERMGAETAPHYILMSVKARFPNGSLACKQEIQQFVMQQVWDRSFTNSRGAIKIMLAAGKDPKKYIQEAREALSVLKRLGWGKDNGVLRFYEDSLKETIGEE